MPLQDLGSINFLEAPTVNSDQVITTLNNSIPYFSSGLFSALPTAGNVGRLYLTTDTQRLYRDNGTSWDILMYGSIPLIRQVLGAAIPANTGTTIIPQDNTAPTITEGTQIWTQAFTPSYTGSSVNINMTLDVNSGTNNRMIIASIFRGNTNIGVANVSIATAARPQILTMNIIDTSISTAAVTYSCRVGISSAATWYVNSNSTSFYAGLLTKHSYSIMES
jgi:hypothetical protein